MEFLFASLGDRRLYLSKRCGGRYNLFYKGHYRYHEGKLLMTVNSGMITSHKHWRNRVIKEGMDIE
ncbi:MAG: hypothetical protein IKV14_04155 [Muribaculaceae bacterium]|nr:hypothetical protein [Muribaculaceae bacterium]